MPLVTPPDIADMGGEDKLIFLAGPMKGSREVDGGVGWQFLAAEILDDLNPDLYVASPRALEGFATETDFEMQDQVRWESHHLARAAFNGVQLYWYAEQGEEVPRRDSEFVRPYAKTTNKELFEWLTKRHVHPEIAIVLGSDPTTSGLGYERERLGWDIPDIGPIETSLEALCRRAVLLAEEHTEPIDDFEFWTPDNPYA